MNPERAKQLENFLLENPLDAFTKYALALEYIGTDDQLAARLFEEVLLENPGYLPTYYHAAQLFAELGRRSDAVSTYEKGIDLASVDQKALAELKNAYQNFLFDDED